MDEAMEVLLDQLREMTPAEMRLNLDEASSQRDATEIILQQANDRLEADNRVNGYAREATVDAILAARNEAKYWTIRYWMLRAALTR